MSRSNLAAVLLTVLFVPVTQADRPATSSSAYADSHAPIGVMGDHMHKAGEWMFSYRYMFMHMDGNRDGHSSLSPTQIATTVPNRFFGNPGQPPTLRVVPTQMDMQMHMLGAMYAPNDDLTLMLMGSYQRKSMDHLTFMGGAGTTVRGEFTTVSEGFGDTQIRGLFRIHESPGRKAHLTLGLSLPTGSIHKKDTILTPAGATPRVRLPYSMQLGSGTWDLITGVTANGWHERWSWGGQYLATLRTHNNEEHYRLGDIHQASSWVGYRFRPSTSGSLRLTAKHSGQIDGIDDEIILPVQTADPDRQGGKTAEVAMGFNFAPQVGRVSGWRLAGEFSVPVYRNLNGPQLETDWYATVGLQKGF